VWSQITIPGATSLTDIWGVTANEIYVAAFQGVFSGSAGGTWAPVAIPASFQLGKISAINGTRSGDLLVAGATPNGFKVLRRSGDAWTDLDLVASDVTELWPRDNGELCAAGNKAFLRRDSGWLEFPLSSGSSLGGGGNDCYFGSFGGLHQINADGFLTRVPLLVDPNVYVQSIWAYDERAVFVVVAPPFGSSGGDVFQGDGGSTWTKIAHLLEPSTIWGPSGDELYIGTDLGVVHGERR
jgi:hypothetical protein